MRKCNFVYVIIYIFYFYYIDLKDIGRFQVLKKSDEPSHNSHCLTRPVVPILNLFISWITVCRENGINYPAYLYIFCARCHFVASLWGGGKGRVSSYEPELSEKVMHHKSNVIH